MASTADDPLRKLRIDDGTVSTSLPKDDMRAEGVLDENDELDGPTYAKVEQIDERTWRVEVLEL